ncbi:MAG: asparagine synthase C-terminal domain-containing protein, partial [Ignavibacteria bacterium]
DNHQLNNENVTAYSAVFPGFRYDESAIIDDFLKTCRHVRSVKLSLEKPDLFNSINKFVYGMGEPVFSATSFAHYTLMKDISKQNVKVVLNGQGADEVWGGYDRYFIGYFLLDILMRSPHKFISQANAIFGKMKFSYKYILMQTLKALSSRKYASYLRAKYAHKVLSCMSKDFTRNNYNYFKNSEYKKLSSGNLSGYMKYNIEYQGFNQILHYEDHSSMQNSIEMRSPFIDYRLVELAFTLPSEKKIDNGITKKILRDIFNDKLPSSIINNYKKIGFVTPFENWINEKSSVKFINEMLNSDSFKNKKIFDPKKVKKKFSDSSDKDINFPYWRFINLELWSQVYGIKNL